MDFITAVTKFQSQINQLESTPFTPLTLSIDLGNGKTFDVERFNYETLSPSTTTLIIGVNAPTKEALIVSWINALSSKQTYKPLGVYNKKLPRWMKDRFPDFVIHDKLNAIDRCLASWEAYENRDSYKLIGLNEIKFGPSHKEEEFIRKLIYAGRHYNITSVFDVEQCGTLPPWVLHGCEYLILDKMVTHHDQRKVHSLVNIKGLSFLQFQTILNAMQEKGLALCINQCTQKPPLSWCEANKWHPVLPLGTNSILYWEFAIHTLSLKPQRSTWANTARKSHSQPNRSLAFLSSPGLTFFHKEVISTLGGWHS